MAVADTPIGGGGSISQKSNAASAEVERYPEQIDAPALVKAARPSVFRYEFETANYWGKSYKTIDNATDPQECARACDEDSQCRVASFHGPKATGGWANRCVLRQAVGERHTEQVDTSSWVKP